MSSDVSVEAGDILLVDDERTVRDGFRSLLESDGYEVRVARGGTDALRKFAERRPGLVILDVMMPDLNGIAVCKEIRKTDAVTPVLFFTAAPSECGLVRAFGSGGDDYISKTCSAEELLARVGAAIRRRGAIAAASKDTRSVRIGEAVVDLDGMTICVGGEREPLTKTEAQVLKVLVERRGEFVSNNELFDAVYGADYIGDPTRMRNFVGRIRAKLGAASAMICHSRSAGYKLLPESEKPGGAQ